MSDVTNENIDETEEARSGDGKSTGKSSGGGGGTVIRLPPNKLAEVLKTWKAHNIDEAAARVAEFFSEGVAKASAHAVVQWERIKGQEGFTIISEFVKWGQEKGREIAFLLQNLSRENAEILRSRYGLNVTGLG